jgi:UDP-2-acetamido-3-amino-2,3-dideoxy-glucuronate N-acetyltransferase
MPDYFVHESSYVDDGAIVGAGTKIWHFSHVMPGAVIGAGCNLGQNVVIMPGTRIGNNVKIQNNVSVYEGVELEDDVFCGPSCVFTNVMNPRSHVSRKSEYRRTLVKRGATIGANATVICGVVIGEYAFIGAGAVVRGDVLPYALMVGVPARRVGWTCQCGTTLKVEGGGAECAACGTGYREVEGRLVAVDPAR